MLTHWPYDFGPTNYLSIPKLHRWSLPMDKLFHPTLYNGCNYLSMLGLKFNNISKRNPRHLCAKEQHVPISQMYITVASSDIGIYICYRYNDGLSHIWTPIHMFSFFCIHHNAFIFHEVSYYDKMSWRPNGQSSGTFHNWKVQRLTI